MREFIRGIGALTMAFMVFRAVATPVDGLFIAVFAVVGWLRLFDLCWETDEKK